MLVTLNRRGAVMRYPRGEVVSCSEYGGDCFIVFWSVIIFLMMGSLIHATFMLHVSLGGSPGFSLKKNQPGYKSGWFRKDENLAFSVCSVVAVGRVVKRFIRCPPGFSG